MPNPYAKMFQEGSERQAEKERTTSGRLKKFGSRVFWTISLGLILIGFLIVGFILYAVISV